ncbi:MAG: T9SS type A sorting domain-containing protein, partial [Bacteroidales bacterium]
IETVNGGGNSANFGASLEKNFKVISVANTIVFDITSDYFPSHNAWSLTHNETSELIYSESLSNANEHHITELCLGDGCYTFEITDSNGDGMNGWFFFPDKGSVKITNSTTSEVLWEYTSSGNWTSKTFEFCLDLTHAATRMISLNVFPNPSTGIVNVESTYGISNICVYNNFGQIVENKNYKGQNIIEMDLQSLPNGVYIMKITDNTEVTFKKIVLNK